ncbi:MAG: ATP-binding cassette domain-containing protein [Magnetococcales bacterium]|nr:ATP-binding cassette domain-containing protein [Magnetococcales bacterium]
MSGTWAQELSAFSIVRAHLPELLTSSLVLNVLSLALPLTLLQVYDRILLFEAISTLGMLIFGVVMALLLEGVLRFARSYIGAWIGARFEHMATVSALERLMRTDLGSFERDGVGIHLERMNALNILKEFYAGQAVLVILDMPFVPIFLGLIFHLAGWLVLLPVTLFILFAGATWWVGIYLRKAVEERTITDERRVDFVIEVLNGIHSVKSMAMENMMLRRYERLQESCARNAQKVGRLGSTGMAVGNVFGQLTTVSVVAAGSMLVIDHQLTIGGLAACTMLAGRSLQPVQRAVGIWARFQTIRIAKTRLDEIFSFLPEAEWGLPEMEEVEGHIEMQDVSFRFSPEAEPILHSLNLKAEAGETIGIRGDNGSGKTSLLWLMMGALQPSSGKVFIDHKDISAFDPVSVRSKVAYLPQAGVLFRGTILENIHMFRDDKVDEAVAVIQKLGLNDFLTKMPKGTETSVDDGADESLPKGIKQRLTIARGLLGGSKLVLFDEANSAIDGAGDNKLREVLEEMHGNTTLVLVTHRPSLLALADQVFELKGGTLVRSERDYKGPPPQQKPATPPAPKGKPVTRPAPTGKGLVPKQPLPPSVAEVKAAEQQKGAS